MGYLSVMSRHLTLEVNEVHELWWGGLASTSAKIQTGYRSGIKTRKFSLAIIR
jgi:hypothetical protein